MTTLTGTLTDAHHVPLTRAQRLTQEAAEATEVRRLAEHPDVVALRVEKVARFVDVLTWAGIALGLAFTMVNVQTFAAAGAAAYSLAWCAAWLLDPMVSLTLIAVLRAEQITARYQVATGVWVARTKWFAFTATYLMNTWQSWRSASPAGIVLHSVPPVLVFLVSQTAPVLRDRLTESTLRASAVRERVTAKADSAETGGRDRPVAVEPEPVDVCERTIPIPIVHESTPDPTTTAPTRRPRQAGQSTSTPQTQTGATGARSIEDLRGELAAAIEAGRLDPTPSAESIRKALRISAARARRLRDEHPHPADREEGQAA